MDIAIIVLAAVNLVLLVVLGVQVARVRKRSAELGAQVAEAKLVAQQSAGAEPSFAVPKPMLLTVEILNPTELATTQNKFAGVAAAVAPDMIRNIVYNQAAALMREQLADQGVEAEVTVHASA